MRRVMLALLLLFVATEAQANPADDQPAMAVMKGSAALMFDMGGIFASTPTNFEGIGIGGRYALAQRLHIRAALGFDNSSSEVDPDGGGGNIENKTSNFAIEGGIDYVLFRTDNLLIYTGGILQFGMMSIDPDGEDNETDGTSFTLAGIAGVNWFFTQNVSLGAEYRLGIQRATSETVAAKTTNFVLGTGSAAFLLGFWF